MQPSPARTNRKRTADSYVIESLLKGLLVLEALEGNSFEPISLKEVARRSKQDTNYCFRALQTFAQMGYAKETPKGWILGGRIARLNQAYELRFALPVA